MADELIGALDPAQRARVTVRPVADRRRHGRPSPAARGESTVRTAVQAVRDGLADAVVSAGSTGARHRRRARPRPLDRDTPPGARRHAARRRGPVVLLDVGGTLEPGPATLARHALLGAAYASVAPPSPHPASGCSPSVMRRARATGCAAPPRPRSPPRRCPADGRYVGLVEGTTSRSAPAPTSW
ncbi:hypothetical protein [Micromonospora sp. b486]|uniref:hypothetical protein n=1 Tax=Micromonospora sp. b486 TaxID=3053986 RepID=UPI00259D1EDE|nr:hypothetical protein [Micromonospora sp. b486]MDM4784474.1 hypothetical protein [Micromonospora sp. b486]